MDVIAVHRSALIAIQRARQGDGPTLLEYKTYRYMGHSRGDPAGYRSRQEVEDWLKRDPIQRFRQILVADYGQEIQSLDGIAQTAQSEVEAAVEFALASPEPASEDLLANVFDGGV
jgi:TPP-dependent pyruvate/acetoin dehydrogenase alpha subunit